MTDYIDIGTAAVKFVIGLLVFGAITGLVPGLVLRPLLRIFPKDHPRREELKAELYNVPFLERIPWVFQSIELVCTEGGPARWRSIRTYLKRRREARNPSKIEFVDRPGAADLNDLTLDDPPSRIIGVLRITTNKTGTWLQTEGAPQVVKNVRFSVPSDKDIGAWLRIAREIEEPGQSP